MTPKLANFNTWRISPRPTLAIDGSLTLDIDYEFGSPAGISAILDAYLDGVGEVSLLDTAQISLFAVYDPWAQLVTDASISSLSGTDYNGLLLIPEPASAVLLNAALVVLLSARRRWNPA